MRKLIIGICLATNFGCVSAQQIPNSDPEKISPSAQTVVEKQKPVETIKIDKFVLKLEDCRLSYQSESESQDFLFPFSGGCQFSKNEEGLIRTVKLKKAVVLAVESSKRIENTNDCETQIRGVVVSKDSVKLSAQTQKVAMCLPYIWDEKMFEIFASKVESFPK